MAESTASSVTDEGGQLISPSTLLVQPPRRPACDVHDAARPLRNHELNRATPLGVVKGSSERDVVLDPVDVSSLVEAEVESDETRVLLMG